LKEGMLPLYFTPDLRMAPGRPLDIPGLQLVGYRTQGSGGLGSQSGIGIKSLALAFKEVD
jgi:hypothetical protein